ncbi:hypothetical protein Salat_2430700 [Sesamum alatum]|uniref:Uncharacterized protein n=1 Tax=Sesamum alatum TaxID=300844 RepID=A0AAE1XZ78_9LAMI|nr:hypothetical protein Salat_2430700 [Sesamum alatum]
MSLSLSRSLSSTSLVNPNSEGDGVAAPAEEDESAGTEQSLHTLERLKARWASRYGGGTSRSMSTTVGTLVTASFSGGQSITCALLLRLGLCNGCEYNLPPPRVLLQTNLRQMKVPLSPPVEQEKEQPVSPPMQPLPPCPLRRFLWVRFH